MSDGLGLVNFLLKLPDMEMEFLGSIQITGLLIGHRKKVKFRGIFRDKIAEKSANFTGILREFSGQTWLESNQ